MTETRTQPVGDPNLLDALPMAVVLVDRDHAVTAWNTAAEILYGYAGREVVGTSIVEVMFDTDDQPAAARLFGRVADGGVWDGDCRVRRRDGTLLVSSFRLAPVDATGGAAWIATDQTDQGLAEQERAVLLSAEHAARSTAEEALALVEAILGSAPVGIAVFDLELRYVRVNDAYAELSGLPAEEHVGGRVGDVAFLQFDVVADLRRVVTTGRSILGRHIELGDAEDPADNRHFTASYFPVRTAAGSLVGAGLTLVEVTEAKRAEAERAALLKRAEAAQQRLSILATASSVLTTTMEMDELLNRLTRVLTPSAADWCAILVLGARYEVEHVAVSHRDRRAADELAASLFLTSVDLDHDGPLAHVVRTKQGGTIGPTTIGELLAPFLAGRGQSDAARQARLDSGVVVPIESRGRLLGVFILASDRNRALDDDDLDLAVEIAHRAALAVGNARAFQQEHQIAESLQRALLPTIVPSVPGLELAVRYVAATDRASVGGDWYDVFGFDDGSTGVVVGDVVGHDIGASTSMGQLRSTLRAYAYEDHASPAQTLARIDRRFDSLGLTLASCVFGVIDVDLSTLRWTNAGHPPPVLVRNGSAAFLDGGAGMLLGVRAGSDLAEAETDLRPGDLLVLYTDGLIERRGESIQMGLDRLGAAAAAVSTEEADVVCDALLAALVPPSFTRDDDIAILVARIRPHPSPASVHRLSFEPRPEHVTLTRGFVAGVLQGAGWGEHADTAVLLASELVTNAVRHAHGPCELIVTFGEDEVEVAVADGDPRLPTARPAAKLDDSGRGFLLIEALATNWGVRLLPVGKAIWFTLELA
ncbi:MAG TPA: SpoIIE family protein phosphatase [Acidimicrobiales bacterium]|nr:SpoIIE family protein phosphatase [Acidimicrobiales bacterium]